MHYDVFNGDADGILSLLQLRKYEPKTSTLVTGVKRDIALLEKVVAQGDVSGVTVLDISMEKNLAPLHSLIEKEIPIFYCDHHRTGEVPQSNVFTALVSLESTTCTCLLINNHIGGCHVLWAIAGAFGDNLNAQAVELARAQRLEDNQVEYLKELGTLINYNGYGASLADLHISPSELFIDLMTYDSPFDLISDSKSPYYRLKQSYEKDIANLLDVEPIFSSDYAEVYTLPDAAWARRVSGIFGNALANQSPQKAHAVLTPNIISECYTVSVRAPLENRIGADEVCTMFATGGGRSAAAGINQLPKAEVQTFIKALDKFYTIQE